jgi:3-hydroxyacyl-[acyl-carrier-protein] dehydratase
MRWRLVDTIDELVLGERARGTVCFPPETEFFEDHFPGFPVVPGVILLEAMAQLSGKLIGYTVRKRRGDWPFPILSMVSDVKFRKFVRPGERVELDSELTELRDESAIVRVKARIGTRVHAQATEVFVFNAVPLASPEEGARLESLERAELGRLWKGWPGD